jgi:aldehyde dehydrogenase (NAD+)
MVAASIPSFIPNVVGGEERPAISGAAFEKRDPHDGSVLSTAARSGAEDVTRAVAAARTAQPAWAALTPVRRGEILLDLALALRAAVEDMAYIVHRETGKSVKDARGETLGAVQLGTFMAGEGMRAYGRTLPSGTPNKYCMTMRAPLGVAGLIVPANTPVANVAWKVFPALICGNAAVLKTAEDSPATAWFFSSIARRAGLPAGVLNIVHGLGPEAGAALVDNPDVDVLSFTGSTATGRRIAEAAGRRLARVSLELGGKNPFVVCDDADLDNAVHWAALSAFSNAGQRCAAGSRIVVFDSVYETFRDRLRARAQSLKIGPADTDDLGPVINTRQLDAMLAALDAAAARGARVTAGGRRLTDAAHAKGFYMAPTIVENVGRQDPLSRTELFGPIAALYRANDFADALAIANDTPYGLTAAIHTRNVNRAVEFGMKVRAGVVNVNIGTYGSEPHMPFGGFGQSGNGTREPGLEALDVYSGLKNFALTVDPAGL